jgi:hypothetical protein
MLLALPKALEALIRIHGESVLERYWYVELLVEEYYRERQLVGVQEVLHLKTKVAD